jgi:hypothetical protein
MRSLDGSALPREARIALDEYLAALDAALPQIARGVYVTGSAVLGDWQPGRSDLDILTVTEGRLTDGDVAALEAVHAGLLERPYRDAVYIPAEDIGAGQDPATGCYPSAVDGVFHRARYRPDPVLWATLDRHGLTLRGPAAGSLGADPGPDWLRSWNHDNLEIYWRRWPRKAREALARFGAGDPLPGDAVAWGTLGPGRLHATITTGEIISKTAAADYTAALLPEYADLLARAKAHRLGADDERFTIADGYAGCDLIEAVVNDAAGLRLSRLEVKLD